MRTMRMNSWLAILGLALLIAIPSDAFAQRRGGGSRSRSSSRRSTPKATKRPAAVPSAAKPRAAKPSRGKAAGKASAKKGAWGSDKKKAGKSKKVTKADQKA